MLDLILRHVTAVSLAASLAAGCAVEIDDDVLDPIDECATCADKADAWELPPDDSCEATSMLRLANHADFATLDDDARLNRRAVENIIAAREEGELMRLRDLDDVSYVGVAALKAMLQYVRDAGMVAECEAGEDTPGVGVISDLDKTVVPPAEEHLGLPDAPYPGVSTLYQILERGSDGEDAPGDTTYVTARSEDLVVDMPEWLAEHGLPEGAIETGPPNQPWLSQAEKVRDINRTMDGRPDLSYVMFGDSSHRDPEVYREVLATRPGQVRAALIHKVNQSVSEGRLEGLHLHHNYAEAAAILAGLGILSATDAWDVYAAAVDEGLDVSEAEFEAYLETHAEP